MKCYEHAKTGEVKDAVAVCANCGVGLCMDHLVEKVSKVPRTDENTRTVLCQLCAQVEPVKAR